MEKRSLNSQDYYWGNTKYPSVEDQRLVSIGKAMSKLFLDVLYPNRPEGVRLWFNTDLTDAYLEKWEQLQRGEITEEQLIGYLFSNLGSTKTRVKFKRV